MDYILRGNDKDVANVIKEQRVRVGRGMISFIPISESGLITEEEAIKLFEEKLTEKDAEIVVLTSSVDEKDKTIEGLVAERDNMNTRIAELESCTDTKEFPAGDSKELVVEESVNKEEGVSDTADNKDVVLEDQKKVGRPKKTQ